MTNTPVPQKIATCMLTWCVISEGAWTFNTDIYSCVTVHDISTSPKHFAD